MKYVKKINGAEGGIVIRCRDTPYVKIEKKNI